MAIEIYKVYLSKFVDACARLAKAVEVVVQNNLFNIGQFFAIEIMWNLS